MRRSESSFATPAAVKTAAHLGQLVRQARLARRWTQAELAERARVSLPTLQRLEGGSVSSALGAWLATFEALSLLPLLARLQDPASEAAMDQTRSQRARRPSRSSDLDF